MRRIDLTVPRDDPVEWLEGRLNACGLSVEKFDLKRYPGAVHWHARMPGQKGTLEATWWPNPHILWIEIRGNREADWQKVVIATLLEKP